MKRFLFFAVAAVLFAACSKDALDEQQGIQNIVDEAPATLTVGFEDDETRIQLNEAQKTVWTNGDLVSVFYRSNANQKWQYTGETGARTADLTRVDAGEATTKTTRVVVVYPYNEDYYFNTETYNVQASLPATQTYLKDSYGLDGNIMVSSSEFNQFKLKTVYGWLKLQLTGSGEQIKSISLCGNDGEQVAGDVVINTTDATITLAADGDKSDATIFTEVTLDCGEGVELGAEATAFYIALPPQTFTKGLTVEITAIDGSAMTQSTDNEVVIERNHIKPMTEFTFKATKPANNEIWYTNGSTTAPTAPNDPAAFGSATIQSNTYDAEKECWVITFDKEVTKIGYYAFCECSSLTSVTIPDSVTTIGGSAFDGCTSLTSVTIGNSVTTIGVQAFYNCDSLTSVTIGDGVTTIGENAFYNCKSLTSVTIPDSVTTIGTRAFYGCDSLTSVTIPDSVTTIGDYAFSWCTSLTSVTIPDSVTTIGNDAFSRCKSLTSVTIGKGVTSFGSDVFAGCRGELIINSNIPSVSSSEHSPFYNSQFTKVTIGDSVTTIGDYAFRDCESLTSVTIGDSVTTIGGSAFLGCTSLTSVTIGNSVKTIGEWAFYDCDSLTSVTIPDSVTTIGVSAFNRCYSLTSVTIGNSVTTIGNYAFYLCRKLTSVTIPDSVTTIGYSAFAYCSSLKEFKGKFAADGGRCLIIDGVLNAFAIGCGVTQYTIPDSVTTIGNGAFYWCDSLTSVTIPDSVTTIGASAFYWNDSLTSVTIGDSVTTIGNYAFYWCDSLTSVTIPDSVTTIGEEAFSVCTSLTSVTIGNSVTTIGIEAFNGCYSLTSVTIPDSVTTIGDEAFYGCTSLATVYCKPTTPPAGGDSMFDNNAAGRRIFVPASDDDSIINAYKAKEYWRDYANFYIFEDASL